MHLWMWSQQDFESDMEILFHGSPNVIVMHNWAIAGPIRCLLSYIWSWGIFKLILVNVPFHFFDFDDTSR